MNKKIEALGAAGLAATELMGCAVSQQIPSPTPTEIIDLAHCNEPGTIGAQVTRTLDRGEVILLTATSVYGTVTSAEVIAQGEGILHVAYDVKEGTAPPETFTLEGSFELDRVEYNITSQIVGDKTRAKFIVNCK